MRRRGPRTRTIERRRRIVTARGRRRARLHASGSRSPRTRRHDRDRHGELRLQCSRRGHAASCRDIHDEACRGHAPRTVRVGCKAPSRRPSRTWSGRAAAAWRRVGRSTVASEKGEFSCEMNRPSGASSRHAFRPKATDSTGTGGSDVRLSTPGPRRATPPTRVRTRPPGGAATGGFPPSRPRERAAWPAAWSP